VSTEALVLAVVSIIRPTTAAAVWAMLVSSRPRRLLAAYLLAGMGISLAVGIAVVLAAGDTFSGRSGHHLRAGVLVVLGLVALLGAVAVQLGWMRRSRPDLPATVHRRRHRLSPAGAAATGVLTHLPGVFYLAALAAISEAGAAATGAVVQVVVYNLVWFAPAIVALGVCLFGTIPSADRLAGAVAWGRAHQDPILTVCFAGVGIWLIVKGVVGLG
jgi:Sap, sulfolipid-1-addressing protein